MFMELPDLFLSDDGYIGYIVPTSWTKLSTDESLREKLLTEFQIRKLLDCGRIFQSAVVETLLLIATKDNRKAETEVEIIDKSGTVIDRLNRIGSGKFESKYQTNQDMFLENENKTIDYSSKLSTRNLIRNIESRSIPLSEICDISQGVTAYDRHAGQDLEIIENRAYHSDEKEDGTYGKWLNGKDVHRYHFSWKNEWLSYGDWLSRPREKQYFTEPRLIFREVTGGINRVYLFSGTAKEKS